jgi:hypothetical protein
MAVYLATLKQRLVAAGVKVKDVRVAHEDTQDMIGVSVEELGDLPAAADTVLKESRVLWVEVAHKRRHTNYDSRWHYQVRGTVRCPPTGSCC